MITNFDEHKRLKPFIRERVEINMDIYNFIENYLKNNNTLKYFTLEKYIGVLLLKTRQDFIIFKIRFFNDIIEFNFLESEKYKLNFKYDDVDNIIECIREHLDDFYKYMIRYMLDYHPSFYIIPVIDINKFCDFIEFLIKEYSKMKELKSNYSNIVDLFVEYFLYNDNIYNDIKLIFKEKLGHYINAKNFDLI